MKFISAFIVAAVVTVPAFARVPARPFVLSEASNTFGIQSLGLLFKEQGQKNVVYSPLSAHLALSMLANGGRNNTGEQMLSILDIPTHEQAFANQQVLKLIGTLTSRPKGELTLMLANGVWTTPGAPIKADYARIVKHNFKGEVTALESAEQINAWAARNTNNLITKVIDDIGGLEMILANATYFKADWTLPFKKSVEGSFQTLNAGTTTADMMDKQDTLKHAVYQQYEAVELTYGPSALASMILILPTRADRFVAARDQLNEHTLTQILAAVQQAEPAYGAVKMPKFEFKTSFKMNEALIAMGMRDAFTNSADFSALSDAFLKVSFVKQDAVIKVHEKGTEAAAVTAIGMERTSIDPTPKFSFVADRPFIYVIRDNETGVILFVGQVVSP